MKKNTSICISIILIILATNVFAEQIQPQQPYTVEMQVSGDGIDERRQVFAKALDQVLVNNNTGPAIKVTPFNPSVYVQRFTYINRGTALFLQVKFNQASITQLLQQATKPEQTNQLDSKSKKLALKITNVNGLAQYNEVVQYLTAFGQITQVDLVKISTSEVELSVSATDNQQALLTALSAQSKLVRNPGVDLSYKWVTVNNEQFQATNSKPMP